MFARRFLSTAALFVCFSALADPSADPRWLRLYQYKNGVSPVTAPAFFFSPEGRRNPRAEMAAARAAFLNGGGEYGIQKAPAACVFPARRLVLEKLLSEKFPDVACPDLDEWIKRLAAERAYLVFVGSYDGNPASILGHTFVRLSSVAREGMDLLSYSVGFAATPEADDNRMMYMLKGLTGGYPGFYEIEPHYMKVGLYNNSESRDLWELPLKFNADEMRMLALHLWELTFNASMDYYFSGRNCSYRLLTWLEAAKPELNVSRHFNGLVTLPAETVRAMMDSGVVEITPRFRASVQRRLRTKIAAMSRESRRLYDLARVSLPVTRSLKDPEVAAALLDYWIFENYQAKGSLSLERRALMEAVYARVNALASRPEPVVTPVMAPFQGHRSRSVEVAGGDAWRFGLRGGGHPLWSSDPGYAGDSAIEYLGLDFHRRDWRALLIRAQAMDGLAWKFLAALENGKLRVDGGLGWAGGVSRVTLYALAQAETRSWVGRGVQGLLGPSAVAGARLDLYPVSVWAEAGSTWWPEVRYDRVEARVAWAVTKDVNLFGMVAEREVAGGVTIFY